MIADKPDGRIIVQAIGARTLGAGYPLDPAEVAYAPVWVEELPRGNIVTVRYTGDQSESVTTQDATSIALYGERSETIDTPDRLAGGRHLPGQSKARPIELYRIGTFPRRPSCRA